VSGRPPFPGEVSEGSKWKRAASFFFFSPLFFFSTTCRERAQPAGGPLLYQEPFLEKKGSSLPPLQGPGERNAATPAAKCFFCL